jgi:NAD(P)-dependent dehydrogenase (short-subunit alcohol dehydrogenase family)
VVCTGGSGGIGRAVCAEFARAGARVLVVDRDAADCAAVVGDLPGAGHDALAADLSDLGTAETLPATAQERLGSCDVLVHMAAVLHRRPLAEVTEADWDRQLDINLKATFFLARAAAEHMREHAVAGRLVLFASQAWWSGGYGGSAVYAASKGGVVSLVRGFAREYGPAGITVNALAPGSVDTPMLRTGLRPEALDDTLAATPLRRLGSPAEIATATVFMASANASFISGTTLNVSGGWLTY